MGESTITYFVGEFTHSLDSKGRLTIPSKWRIPEGDNTYLGLPNPGGYITVYPPKMVARLEGAFAPSRGGCTRISSRRLSSPKSRGALHMAEGMEEVAGLE